MATQPRTATSKQKALPPAGTRPPAPPWAKLIAWLALVVCLGLLVERGPLLSWAAQQPLGPLTPTATMPAPAQAPAPTDLQGLERVAGIGAALIRLLLLPPGLIVIQSLGVLGLTVIGLELSVAAFVFVVQTALLRRQAGISLRVRVPQPAGARAGAIDTGADLLRALHRQLPATGAALGQAPWIALTLGARPDEPVELGVVIAGGTPAQRRSWAAAVRKTIQGLVSDAVIDERADPLAEACRPGRIAAWTEWRPALPAAYPFRLAEDRGQADLLGPLVAALQPRQGVAYTELQLVLQARLDDVHLARGWRAAATRRWLGLKNRNEYALPPDAQALESKLQGPVYHATLRTLAIAEPGCAEHARAELREAGAVIGQYAARSGSRLQRWSAAGGRTLRVPARPARTQGIGGAVLTLAGGLLAGSLTALLAAPVISCVATIAGRWPLLDLPAPLARLWPMALTILLPLLATLVAMALLRWSLGRGTQDRLRPLITRVPRAVPLPGLLWGSAWRGPAILGPDELTALWHLPTPALGRLVRWLSCRYLPPPPHAFAPPPAVTTTTSHRGSRRTGTTPEPAIAPATPPARLIIGYGRHRDASEAPVGIPLRDARQGIAFTAPPGVGKTQLASNLADQLRLCGYTLIDGKGDDAGNLVETMRKRIPLADEDRLVVLDVLDADWPIGLNPLAGVNLRDTGVVDQVLGQIEAIFARLDPETWTKAPRMKNYLRKATLLVLAGEAHPTIAHVKQALLDDTYRRALLPRCTNVEVTDFWTVEFPQIGEQQKASRDALVSRFDMLLDSELTRYLFNQTIPALSFHDAIAERLIVLAPLPHRTLGGLAGPVGMLLFQSLMRAAFSRPGSDLTRPEYGFIGDEFQVLVENCDTKDVRDALTQVRAFGIITIIANQLHRQLGDLADYALTAISNRILLRTQEPDATLYARHYAESGISAADIAGQEPREHQYAWIGVNGRLTRLFSMRPLPWQQPLELTIPTYEGEPWQQLVPPDSETPAFDRVVCALMYEAHVEREAIAEALARSDDERWAKLLRRWDAIRAFHRAYILANPGCILDTAERQLWLSRLRAARPRVLAMAEYARIRQVVTAGAGAPVSQRGGQQSGAPTPPPTIAGHEPRPTQQPRFTELDQRQASRLNRAEPDDLQTERPVSPEEGAEPDEMAEEVGG